MNTHFNLSQKLDAVHALHRAAALMGMEGVVITVIRHKGVTDEIDSVTRACSAIKASGRATLSPAATIRL